MSKENIEVLRRLTDAVNRGDVEAAVQAFDPDVVFEPQRASVEGAYRGHSGIRQWLADTQENFTAYRLEVDLRELEDGRVLSIGLLHLRGGGSGVETDIPVASIASLRDGGVLRLKDYGDRRKALEAAGLSE